MPFDPSGMFGRDEWDSVASILTDDAPVPGTSTFKALSTDELSSTIRFVSPDDSLQSAVDDVAVNGGAVYLEAGLHDSHNYPVTVPSGVTVQGSNMGSGTPNGEYLPTVLDPAGGVALKVHDGETVGKATTLRNFAALGTIQYTATTNRDFLLENIYVENADSAAATGRGVEILNTAFLYSVRNIHIEACDGYGYYQEHGGQATVDTVRCFDNAGATDGAEMYISDHGGGGGEGEYRRLIAGIGSGTAGAHHGIEVDNLYQADVYAVQIEKCDRGLIFTETNGGSKGNVIHGGRIVDNSIGIKAGQTTTDTVGTYVEGVKFDGNSTIDIDLDSSTRRWNIGPCIEDSAGQQIGAFTHNNAGFENTIDLVNNFVPNGTGEDLTTRAPKYANEIALHDGTDGTSTNPRGPAIANGNDPSTASWQSFMDGNKIN